MSKDDNPRFEENSDIAPVTLPAGGFQSRLPAYLLDGKSEAERYLLNEMSRNTHFIEWAAPILVSSNLESRKTNGKLKVLWRYKEIFTGWKGAAAAVAGLAAFIASVIEILPWIKAILFGPTP